MKRILGVVFLLCLMSASPAPAAEDDVIEVLASGIGVDSDSALKNAYKNAVEQAVGSLVDTRTMVENDEIIADKILSHSGGYVASYDMVGEPKTDGGLVTVKIQARVKRTQLLGSIRSEGLIISESVADDLNAAVATKATQSLSAMELFQSLWEGFPDNYLTASFTSGEPVEGGKKFEVKVETAIDENQLKAFNKRAMEVLSQISSQAPETLRYKIVWDRGMMTHAGDVAFPAKDRNTVCVRNLVNADNTLVQYKRYTITKEMMQYFDKQVGKKLPVMRITIVDNSGDILKEKVYKIPQPFWQQMKNCLVLAPYLFREESCNYIYNWHVPGTPTVTYSYVFDDLFEEEIANIGSVRITVEKAQ